MPTGTCTRYQATSGGQYPLAKSTLCSLVWSRVTANIAANFVAKRLQSACAARVNKVECRKGTRGAPRTRRRFERTEPRLERPATWLSSLVPLVRATQEMMSSTTLPKVAFTRPPTTSPHRSARSSVTSPRIRARGMMPTKFCGTGHGRSGVGAVAAGPRHQHAYERAVCCAMGWSTGADCLAGLSCWDRCCCTWDWVVRDGEGEHWSGRKRHGGQTSGITKLAVLDPGSECTMCGNGTVCMDDDRAVHMIRSRR